MNSVDVAIVGGGPAGAATACALAAAGREVVLLEGSAEPRHKVCGEFLSVETLASLDRLGIDPSALGAVPIDRVTLYGRTVALPFRAMSLSRFRLDQEILDRATQLGAEVWRGIVVRSAEPQQSGWHLRCSTGRAIRCRIVIAATGKRGLRGLADRRDASMVGLKMHLKLPAEATRALCGQVALFLFERGYAGLELVEDGIANLCLLLPANVVAGIGRGWPGLRDFLAATVPALAGPLDSTAALWEKPRAVVCPAGSYLHPGSSRSDNPLYPVGDRLAHIPPFTGDGLAIALHSAASAAEHISRNSSPTVYLAEMRCQMAPALRVARAVSRLAASQAGSIMLMSVARCAPGLLRMIARRTRHRGGRW